MLLLSVISRFVVALVAVSAMLGLKGHALTLQASTSVVAPSSTTVQQRAKVYVCSVNPPVGSRQEWPCLKNVYLDAVRHGGVVIGGKVYR